MLTPSANDPNRKKELERRQREPETFGNKDHIKPQPGEIGRLPKQEQRR